ncbi:hypothetical protein PO909_032667 [Leuciscus waleckii]
MKSGFYSPCFIVPKKGGGLRPILDLRVLNRALHKLPFKMKNETFSEAPGAYGIRSHSNPARVASYETTSTLASRPGPEMGVAERHVLGFHYPTLSPNLQPVVGPFVSTGRCSPRTSVQSCCGLHGCLCHQLGGHVQRACSFGFVDGASAALAYQLLRVASSMSCSQPLQGAASRQACTGPYGQHRTDLPPAHKPAPPPPKKKSSDMKGGLTPDEIQNSSGGILD